MGSAVFCTLIPLKTETILIYFLVVAVKIYTQLCLGVRRWGWVRGLGIGEGQGLRLGLG